MATCGVTLKFSFDSIVQSPTTGCRSRFLAVLVVVLRSPVSGWIVSAPPDSLSVAAFWRTQLHCGPGAESLNSSLLPARPKFTV